jgi:hypothetical protein
MRLTLVVLAVLALSSMARADLDSTITDQKEEGLEADSTAMEIHDVESEQKLAREQARAQEQMKDASDKRLKQLQTQQANMSQKYKLDIMLSETRRKKAEADTLVVKKQIQSIQLSMKNLQAIKDKAEKAAIDARAIADAGRETLRGLQQKKTALEVDTRHAVYDNQKAQLELANLRAQAQSRKAQQAKADQSQIK